MDTGRLWIGLDLGLRRTHVCMIDDDGQTIREMEADTSLTALESAISPTPIDRIGLIAVEAGSHPHVVGQLRAAGYPVAIFEARQASKFLALRRNKTDASDARGLADIARIGRQTVSEVFLKSPEFQQLRGQLVMRKRLVMLRIALEGALRSRLALYGCQFKSTAAVGGVRRQLETHLGRIKQADGVDLTDDLLPLVDMCESLRAYLNRLDAKLEKRAKGEPECRLLMEVPGVGPLCALSFYSAIQDPTRFKRAADVAAYLGLVPRRYQSGEVSRTLGITKCGSKLTRTHLVTAATVFGIRAPDCALKDWYNALRERAGPRRARVALARKLAVILLTMWKSGAHFELRPASSLRAVSAASYVCSAGRTPI